MSPDSVPMSTALGKGDGCVSVCGELARYLIEVGMESRGRVEYDDTGIRSRAEGPGHVPGDQVPSVSLKEHGLGQHPFVRYDLVTP